MRACLLATLSLTTGAFTGPVFGETPVPAQAPPTVNTLAAKPAPPAAAPLSAATVDTYRREIGPVMANYCVKCHSGGKPKAGFDMSKLDLRELGGKQSKKWYRIAEQMRHGEMPPPEKPQPNAVEVKRVVTWLAAELRRAGIDTSDLDEELTGKYLAHEALFTGPLTVKLNNPPRLWRFSPEIYSRWIMRSGEQLTSAQAMNPASGQIFKDWADEATVDEGALSVVLRNAQQTAKNATAHKVEDGKIVPAKGALGGIATLFDPQVPVKDESLKGTINFFAFYRRWGRYSDDELKPFIELFKQAEKTGGREAALRAVLVAVQLQPESLYRLELGLGPADARGYRLLGSRELAYSISFAFGDLLEKDLAEAAGKGKLATREDAVAVIQGNIESDSYPQHARILRFFREYFGYTTAPDVFKDNAAGRGHHGPTLVRDTDLLILRVLKEDKDVLKTLLTTNLSFVAANVDKRTGVVHQQVPKIAIHKNYGLDAWPAAQPVALPPEQRAGILTQPSWLVAQSGNFDNHPVQRGKWIREKLLGGVVPDLPITVNAQVPDATHRTLRDKLNEVTKVEYCWQCHNRMNQLGLPFEQYDHLGKFRIADVVVDPDKPPTPRIGKDPLPVMRALPLDVSGGIERSGEAKLDGPVENPVALMKRLGDSPRVRQVFVRHAFRYWMGRDENLGDAATLRAADEAYVKSGGSMKALLTSLLTSDSFLYRTLPK